MKFKSAIMLMAAVAFALIALAPLGSLGRTHHP